MPAATSRSRVGERVIVYPRRPSGLHAAYTGQVGTVTVDIGSALLVQMPDGEEIAISADRTQATR